MIKEPIKNFVLRKNNTVDNENQVRNNKQLPNTIIISDENPETSGLSLTGLRADILYKNNTKELYGNLILNKLPLADLTYVSSDYSASAVVVSGTEADLITTTGLQIELPDVMDYGQWLFTLPTGYRQQFCTITMQLGAFYNDPLARNSFLIESSPDGLQWHTLLNLGSIPTPAAWDTDVTININQFSLIQFPYSLYTSPNNRYLRIINIGEHNTNVFRIKNLTYSSYDVDSDWQRIINFNNNSWFKRYYFQAQQDCRQQEIFVPNDGTNNNLAPSERLPYTGYYHVDVFIDFSYTDDVNVGQNQFYAASLYVLNSPGTSPFAQEEFLIDRSISFNPGVLDLRIFVHSLQGSKIMYSGEAGETYLSFLIDVPDGNSLYKHIGAASYCDISYIGETLP